VIYGICPRRARQYADAARPYAGSSSHHFFSETIVSFVCDFLIRGSRVLFS
jgi:hypothetical protein